MRERIRIRVLKDDGNDWTTLETYVGQLPVPFEVAVEAYDDFASTDSSFARVLRDWPLTHLWPVVNSYAKSGEIDCLVTFLNHDPDGGSEMEFFLQDGELIG